jgi:hypothetical protein
MTTITYLGKTWTRTDATTLACEDGRRVLIAEATQDGRLGDILTAIDESLTARAQERDAVRSAREAARGEAVVKYLLTHTPAEIEAYVAANVGSLAEAKVVIGKLAVAVAVLAREAWQDR